jgi:hypothetical protein
MEGNKRKYLYMDRFEKFQVDDTEWKKQCAARIAELRNINQLLISLTGASLLISICAIIWVIVK